MPNLQDIQIVLANPRGFCAGVDRAILIVENALKQFGAPIYVRHEIVHNLFVVERLREMGAVFVDELDEVPQGSTVIFSAHGVSELVKKQAAERGLNVFDATCPLVTKVHVEVKRLSDHGYEIIMIGHKGHPEVEGTVGQISQGVHLVEDVDQAQKIEVLNPERLAFVTQTTLSVDDTRNIIDILQSRFPQILAPKKGDICYATQNRQDAVKALSREVDLVIVVGSPNSSNSNRLRELAEKMNLPAVMIDHADDVNPQWFKNQMKVGVTAGASAPETLVQSVISAIRKISNCHITELDGVNESIKFSMPKGLSSGVHDESISSK